jgi:hypothetical protein
MNIFVKVFKKIISLIMSPVELWGIILNNQKTIKEINSVMEQHTQLISHLASVQNEMVNVIVSREFEMSKESNSLQIIDDSDEFIN